VCVLCVYLYTYMHTYTYVCMYIHAYMGVCVHAGVFVCMCYIYTLDKARSGYHCECRHRENIFENVVFYSFTS
jgi:hypothetical protein